MAPREKGCDVMGLSQDRA